MIIVPIAAIAFATSGTTLHRLGGGVVRRRVGRRLGLTVCMA
jgi:hypothetical protein